MVSSWSPQRRAAALSLQDRSGLCLLGMGGGGNAQTTNILLWHLGLSSHQIFRMNWCMKVLANFDEVNGAALEFFFYDTCTLSTHCPNCRVKTFTINNLAWAQHSGRSDRAPVGVDGTCSPTAAPERKLRDVVGLELPGSSSLGCGIAGTVLEPAWSQNSCRKPKMQIGVSSPRWVL